jgi:hypothetical protein
MAFAADFEILFDRLGDEMRGAPAPASDLFATIIACACTRITVLAKAGKVTRISQLVEIDAWTEAALALIEIELPSWKLRRIVYEDGEWLCSLTRQPHLPLTLDDSVEVVHEVLALAILQAFLQARRANAIVEEAVSAVPQIRQTGGPTVCCDNFA